MKTKVENSARRSAKVTQAKKQKTQAKLKRRLAQKAAEKADPSLREKRLAENVTRTVDNTKIWLGDIQNDPRLKPVQFVSNQDQDNKDDDANANSGEGAGDGDGDNMKLDMAGLESLFPSTSALHQHQGDLPEGQEADLDTQQQTQTGQEEQEQEQGQQEPQMPKILLTTNPRPSKPCLSFLPELQSLFGGPSIVEIIPRKNARYELSKVTKWASKRNYTAMIVVGEDNKKNPASVTVVNLPLGPTAHFRLTSITPNKKIYGHGAPTPHHPELVMSNFSTPLGLSVGHVLQSLFPPVPEIAGRQVVVVHNQRDFVFFRRYRYMFEVRSEDASVQKFAKQHGMDKDIRTRMQEIGPRFTMKLRWIKKGTLEEGRKNGVGLPREATHKERLLMEANDHDDAKEMNVDHAFPTSAQDNNDNSNQDQGEDKNNDDDDNDEQDERTPEEKRRDRNRAKKHRTINSKGKIMIPSLVPTANTREGFKKRKKPSSILDTINLQGGMDDDSKEFAWKPSMNKKKRFMFM